MNYRLKSRVSLCALRLPLVWRIQPDIQRESSLPIGMPIACLTPGIAQVRIQKHDSATTWQACGRWSRVQDTSLGHSAPILVDSVLGRCGDPLVRSHGHWRGRRRSACTICGECLRRNRRHRSAARTGRLHFTLDGRWISVSRHWLGRLGRDKSASRYRSCVHPTIVGHDLRSSCIARR